MSRRSVLKPRSTVSELDEAGDREAGAGEQRQRERELGDDEHAPHPLAAAADRGAARFLQHVVQVEPLDLPRRRGAEQTRPTAPTRASVKSSTGTFSRMSASDGSVFGGISARMPSIRKKRAPGRAAPPAAARTTLSVRNCSEQASARRAERRAHRHLALARRAAREQQVGDVRARDQQHEADRAEQQPERGDQVRRRGSCS